MGRHGPASYMVTRERAVRGNSKGRKIMTPPRPPVGLGMKTGWLLLSGRVFVRSQARHDIKRCLQFAGY